MRVLYFQLGLVFIVSWPIAVTYVLGVYLDWCNRQRPNLQLPLWMGSLPAFIGSIVAWLFVTYKTFDGW